VAANRGASGIDGVLSSAAGFAEGLRRGTTLVVGDVSFLHDINGLNLLRTSGETPAEAMQHHPKRPLRKVVPAMALL
jgi:isochorismate synthase / 2-succinyl-5-enolpyruvyl-6-hydroxy-3-cyclohexene-1-carboxylate synthase / 2-succinyl-6-hydroxy-2,4-cyclohexadiene-1-carboxylate synthase / o-succinylbenzoate synthase